MSVFIKSKGRQCKNKKEPYCHLHVIDELHDNSISHKDSSDTNSKIIIENKLTNHIECPICYENYTADKIIHTSCKHPVCKNCLIKSGSTICCICRNNIISDIDKDTLDLISFIKSKDIHIEKLDKEINSLRTIFRMLGL